MATVRLPPTAVPANSVIEMEPEPISSDSEDSENIPYHARENAQPFSYGNLPEGFSQQDLNHVVIEEAQEGAPISIPKAKRVQNVYPASPTVVRKSTRPSISPSRPVLRKTPTRQEFEEMLMERREQALRDPSSHATKIAQNAAIQKDLDALQEKLNKTVLFAEQQERALPTPTATSRALVRHVESIDLPDAASEQRLALTAANSEPSTTLVVAETKRSETPTFPVKPATTDRCISPYPAITTGSPTMQRTVAFNEPLKFEATPPPLPPPPASSGRLQTPRQNVTNETHEVAPHLVKFAKDSSEFWYKPHMTREDAVALLRNALPGTFLIRSSTTYKNAYGLVLRVARPPLGVAGTGPDELVRHFLLEPTTRGVRLKGCVNEPIFTSLSAFVYQHSINQLALPCTLIIPDRDLLMSSSDAELIAKQKQILAQGAACNVLYLFSCDMESLTGDEAVRKAVYELYAQIVLPTPLEVHFKVSQQGITLTDNTRKVFFRRHYAAQNISHFGLDPDQRLWSVIAYDEGLSRAVHKSIFAFVARPLTGPKDNQCHIFCDLAASQPASAIISFAHKVLPLNISNHKML